MKIVTPNAQPPVHAEHLPHTDIQGMRLGMVVAHLLSRGYALRPIPEEHRATLPKGLICGVMKGESPVAFLVRTRDQDVSFILSELGLQFAYDLEALIKSDHWPKPGPLFEPVQNWAQVRREVHFILERATRMHRATSEHTYLVMDLEYIAEKARDTITLLDSAQPDEDAPAAVVTL